MKYLLIILEIQNGEFRHRQLNTVITPCEDINFAGQRYASQFFGKPSFRNDEWWNFFDGEIAVRLHKTFELSQEEFHKMNNYLQ